jgi:hypothetical protein
MEEKKFSIENKIPLQWTKKRCQFLRKPLRRNPEEAILGNQCGLP